MSREITFQIAKKGGVSVYGLGRFPVTLYPEQWLDLVAVAGKLKGFCESNAKAAQTRADEWAAGEAVAKLKGITGDKEIEKFVMELLGLEAGKKTSAKQDLVDALLKKADAQAKAG